MTSLDYELDIEDDEVVWWFSSRLGLAIFAFFGCMSMAAQRVSMDVAIHCMVNNSDPHLVNDNFFVFPTDFPTEFNASTSSPLTSYELIELECGRRPRVFPENLTLHTTWEPTFEWSEEKQTMVFETYFWGFVVSQIPSGWMATRFGGKWVIGGMTLLASVCTGLVPFAAHAHYYTLILTRFLSGFGAGVMFPAMHAMWGRWSPPEERSRLACWGFTGAMLGQTVTYPLATVLCEYGLDGGWPSIFYLLGLLGILFSVLWMLFANSSPLEHGRISKEEKDYIVETLNGEALLNGEKAYNYSQPYDNTPWLSFFGSVPFMVLVVNNFTCEWGMYNFRVAIPYYMRKIVKFNIAKDPALRAFPYIGLGFMVFMTGIWSDKLRLRGVIKTHIVRKSFQFIGTVVPGTMMVGLGFLGCKQAAGAVSMLTLAMTVAAFQYNGYIMNHLDIAPKHAGILLGISTAVGNLAPAVAPMLQRFIVTEDSYEQWQTWLLINATFLLFGWLLFLIGGSGSVQDWAECDDYNKDDSTSSSTSSSPSPPVAKMPPVRSKSLAAVPALTAKQKSDDSAIVPEGSRAAPTKSASQKSTSPGGTKRLSVPDLPSELHRRPSQKATSQSSKKSSAPDVSKLAPTRTVRKRSDVSDDSEGSSRGSNVRRPTVADVGLPPRSGSKHEHKGPPPNLDTLSESIV